jgi:hypothetical protein
MVDRFTAAMTELGPPDMTIHSLIAPPLR